MLLPNRVLTTSELAAFRIDFMGMLNGLLAKARALDGFEHLRILNGRLDLPTRLTQVLEQVFPAAETVASRVFLLARRMRSLRASPAVLIVLAFFLSWGRLAKIAIYCGGIWRESSTFIRAVPGSTGLEVETERSLALLGIVKRVALLSVLRIRIAADPPPMAIPAYLSPSAPTKNLAQELFSIHSMEALPKFFTLLRTRSERGVPHLVVCIGPGTFQTEGNRDYLFGQGHLDKKRPAGFTVSQGWRVHGAGADRTILQLSDLYFDPSTGKYLTGLIIGTHDLGSYGIEVSELTLDDNYSALKSRYRVKLQLQATLIQSKRGQHWIHHIHVTNPAGELAEDFPIEIGSPDPSPTASVGTIVEHVTLDHWGGGECTAIAIANSVSEVRYYTVIGY